MAMFCISLNIQYIGLDIYLDWVCVYECKSLGELSGGFARDIPLILFALFIRCIENNQIYSMHLHIWCILNYIIFFSLWCNGLY